LHALFGGGAQTVKTGATVSHGVILCDPHGLAQYPYQERDLTIGKPSFHPDDILYFFQVFGFLKAAKSYGFGFQPKKGLEFLAYLPPDGHIFLLSSE
jgi:hypothetical protein